jgi:ABC-type sugar transport system permease subunit
MKKTFFKNYSPFLYILPSLVFLAFIFIYPVIQNFQRSFFRFAGGKSIFLGFDNYKYLFLKDTITHKAVLHNFQLLMVISDFTIYPVYYFNCSSWSCFQQITQT